jgi:hypothetical protein
VVWIVLQQAQSADITSFKAQKMERYAPTADDISFDLKYCGICECPRFARRQCPRFARRPPLHRKAPLPCPTNAGRVNDQWIKHRVPRIAAHILG